MEINFGCVFVKATERRLNGENHESSENHLANQKWKSKSSRNADSGNVSAGLCFSVPQNE